MNTPLMPPATLNGYVEGLDENLNLVGWVWDENQPQTRQDVEIFVNDVLLERITANQLREDVRDAGFGDGEYGFVWGLPLTIHPKLPFSKITVRVADTNVVLPHTVTNWALDNPWLTQSMATVLREANHTKQATYLLRALIKKHPTFWHAHISLGDIANNANDYKMARSWFEEATKLAPDELTLQVKLLEQLGHTGAFIEARALSDSLLARLPEDPDILLNRARLERQNGQREKALHFFTQILQQNPAHYEAVTQLASWALVSGNAAQAQALYQAAAIHEPSTLAFHFGHLDAMVWQGQHEAALTEWQALENKLGPIPELQTWLITVLRRLGQTPRALQVARQAATATPEHFWLWMERFQTELLAGSDAMLTKALLNIPSNNSFENALRMRSIAAVAENYWQMTSALDFYTRAAALHPDDVLLQEALSRMKLMRLDLEGAREHLRHQYQLTADERQLRQQSLNISQSLLGQMIDEYALDQPLAETLAALSIQPAPQRLAPMAALVQIAPDNTAPAASLLIALSEAEQMVLTPDLQGKPIPRRIHSFWHEPNLPPDIADLMQSLRDHNPDYEWRRYNQEQAYAYLSATFPAPVAQAFARITEKPQQADLFRLAVLVAEGGIYADADDRCLRSLEPLLPTNATLIMAQETFGCVGNHFIAAAPGHPVLLTALEALVTALNRGDNEFPWLASGPGLLTRSLARFIAAQPKPVVLPAGISILSQRQLGQYVAAGCFALYKTSYMQRPRPRTKAA